MNNDLFEILAILNKLGLYKNVVLIGSWVEYFYSDIIKNYYSQFVTQDYDFLIRRPVTQGENFVKEMISAGFIYQEDYLTNKSKFIKSGMEVEFITNLNRNKTNICRIESMGINAESLENVDILLNNTIVVEMNNIKVQIPSPVAYCLHKLLINHSRLEWKKQKDIDSVIAILIKMIDNNVYIKEMNEIYNSLSNKQKNIIKRVCEENNIIELNKILKLNK